MKKINGQIYLTPPEVAEEFNVVIATVYWWMHDKKILPFIKIGGRFYIKKKYLVNFKKPSISK